MGPSSLIIKRGTEGAMLFSGKNMFPCAAFPVQKCIDPTGAGDTFVGAFIAHLNNSDDISFESMKTGIIKACAMASFCVEDFGVNNIIHKEFEEIKARIDTLKSIS